MEPGLEGEPEGAVKLVRGRRDLAARGARPEEGGPVGTLFAPRARRRAGDERERVDRESRVREPALHGRQRRERRTELLARPDVLDRAAQRLCREAGEVRERDRAPGVPPRPGIRGLERLHVRGDHADAARAVERRFAEELARGQGEREGPPSASGTARRAAPRPWVAHTQFDYARLLLARSRPADAERAALLLAEARATAEELGMVSLARKLAT